MSAELLEAPEHAVCFCHGEPLARCPMFNPQPAAPAPKADQHHGPSLEIDAVTLELDPATGRIEEVSTAVKPGEIRRMAQGVHQAAGSRPAHTTPSAAKETSTMVKKKGSAGGSTYPGDKQIHRRTFTKAVRVGLNPADREPLVKELTDKLTEIDEIKAEAAEVAAGYRRKAKELKETVDELRLKLTQGIPEDMEVEEIKDFKKGTVTTVRLDTRAVVEKRDLTEEDHQLDLGGAPDSADDVEDDDPRE